MISELLSSVCRAMFNLIYFICSALCLYWLATCSWPTLLPLLVGSRGLICVFVQYIILVLAYRVFGSSVSCTCVGGYLHFVFLCRQYDCRHLYRNRTPATDTSISFGRCRSLLQIMSKKKDARVDTEWKKSSLLNWNGNRLHLKTP
jgi:predicted membrane metal-binding protein